MSNIMVNAKFYTGYQSSRAFNQKNIWTRVPNHFQSCKWVRYRKTIKIYRPATWLILTITVSTHPIAILNGPLSLKFSHKLPGRWSELGFLRFEISRSFFGPTNSIFSRSSILNFGHPLEQLFKLQIRVFSRFLLFKNLPACVTQWSRWVFWLFQSVWIEHKVEHII